MRYADSCCKIVSVGSEYVVTGSDVFTGKPVEVRIPAPALFAYRQGAMIQDAMPMLSAEDREFLISGMHDWDLPEETEDV